MLEPEHPTERQILDRIRFHETGEAHYSQYEGTLSMAAWSREQVAKWRKELEALNPPPSVSVLIRDGKMLATGEKE